MKDNLKLIVQVLMMVGGTWLIKHGIDQSQLEETIGAVLTLAGVVFKFWHWNTTPGEVQSPKSTDQSSGGVLPLLLLCFLLPAICLPHTGCHFSPQRKAYTAAATTSVTVETAMREYNAFAAAGKTTVAQNKQVKAAYEKYQAAFALVCDAGAVYAAAGQTNSAGSSAALQVAIVNANQSLTDLINLIQTIGVKL